MFLRSILITGSVLFSFSANAICQDPASAKNVEQNRQECLKQAHFLVNPPDANSESFINSLINPASKKEGFVNGEVVYCRWVYQDQNGNSTKFRCARTDKDNRLMDSKSEVVAAAQGLLAEGDEVYLTGADGKKLMNDKNKPVKALVMKVRYHDGNPRNVENYVSAAASRIFSALGVPAHSNYMTEKIVCFGCESSPFRKQRVPKMNGNKYAINEFVDANIEIKYAGTRMYAPTENPWKWSELNQLYRQSSGEMQTQIEVLALASQFVGAIGTTSAQNAIVCAQFADNKTDCTDVVAMAHDLGAALGSRLYKGSGDAPRGDLAMFIKTPVFKSKSCTFAYGDGGRELPGGVTAAGKAEFMRRATALTPAALKAIASASHLGNLMNLNKKQDPSGLEDRWVQAITNRLAEIQAANCK